MEIIIFYSWQSDLPNATNRGFIGKALEQAANSIHRDETIKIEPVIDRDTKDIPGSPDIANTIFEKIEKAHIFICDVSIINRGSEDRPTPNPNVLIELGYAIKLLGTSRIIMTINNAYGQAELLPFDLRMRRVIQYNMPKSEKDRARERNILRRKLETALRTVFEAEENFLQKENKIQVAEQARQDIENAIPRQVISTRRFMKWLTDEVDAIAPDFSSDKERDDLLLASLEKTEDIVLEFVRVAETLSAMGSKIAAEEIFKSMAPIFEKYKPPRGFSGTYRYADFDYYKFLGHELFVCLVSQLIRDNQWQIVVYLLEQEVYVDNKRRGRSGMINYDFISEYLETLESRNKRLKLNQVSVHADLIEERHSEGILADAVPMEQFVDADFFLFLREGLRWRAWSTIYLSSRVPRFLVEAASKSYAQNLFDPLRIDNIDSLKELITERVGELRRLFTGSRGFFPLEDFDLQTIGSRD